MKKNGFTTVEERNYQEVEDLVLKLVYFSNECTCTEIRLTYWCLLFANNALLIDEEKFEVFGV